MNVKFKRPTIYMSHSMRGDGTLSIEENCAIAVRVGHRVQKLFPEINMYIPGEHDLSLQILWHNNVISVKDILAADLKILRACHSWFWYCTTVSAGSAKEKYEAMHFSKTCGEEATIKTDLLKANYPEIRRLMGPIVQHAVRGFRNVSR